MKLSRAILHDNANDRWLSYQNPIETFVTFDPVEVVELMERVEARVEAEQLIAVGFVSYEAASGFDSALQTHPAGNLPLLSFALFSGFDVVSAPCHKMPEQLWCMSESAQHYCQTVEHIRDLIEAGSVYQVNHTTRLQGVVSDPAALFASVAKGAPHGAYLEGDTHTIVSASPECFFSLDGEHIYSQPMKGTAARQDDPDLDRAAGEWLLNSAKNQAENLMITDMVRNDLGRLAIAGSVNVSQLFALEKYPTVWQLTSRIEARTQASVTQIFRQLFPAASITGAPKRAAMEKIRQLEVEPRDIYTGAIGYIAPNRQAHFNIAIRTAWIDHDTGIARYGAGGGMVWDSNPAEEHQELLSKTRILDRVVATEDFELFETLAWSEREGAINLDRHLARLQRSALVFGVLGNSMDELVVKAEAAIFNAVQALEFYEPTVRHRLRISLKMNGQCEAKLLPLPTVSTEPQAIALAAGAVNSLDPTLLHKTNQRQVYVRAREQVCEVFGDGIEPILVNERGEITETDIANVVYVRDEKKYTPPLSSGLLAGVLRSILLESGELEERVLHVDELAEVQELFLINDLRGWRKAYWITSAN